MNNMAYELCKKELLKAYAEIEKLKKEMANAEIENSNRIKKILIRKEIDRYIDCLGGRL